MLIENRETKQHWPTTRWQNTSWICWWVNHFTLAISTKHYAIWVLGKAYLNFGPSNAINKPPLWTIFHHHEFWSITVALWTVINHQLQHFFGPFTGLKSSRPVPLAQEFHRIPFINRPSINPPWINMGFTNYQLTIDSTLLSHEFSIYPPPRESHSRQAAIDLSHSLRQLFGSLRCSLGLARASVARSQLCLAASGWCSWWLTYGWSTYHTGWL